MDGVSSLDVCAFSLPFPLTFPLPFPLGRTACGRSCDHVCIHNIMVSEHVETNLTFSQINGWMCRLIVSVKCRWDCSFITWFHNIVIIDELEVRQVIVQCGVEIEPCVYVRHL